VYKHPRKPIKTRRIKLIRTYFKGIFSLMYVYTIILRSYVMLNVCIYNILYKRIIYLYTHIYYGSDIITVYYKIIVCSFRFPLQHIMKYYNTTEKSRNPRAPKIGSRGRAASGTRFEYSFISQVR